MLFQYATFLKKKAIELVLHNFSPVFDIFTTCFCLHRYHMGFLQFVVRMLTAMPETTDPNVPVLLTSLETHSQDATLNVPDTMNAQPLW